MMLKPRWAPMGAVAAVLVSALAQATPASAARLYDKFDSGANWTLTGGAQVTNSTLELPVAANTVTLADAQLIGSQVQSLTGTRHSILVRSHTGSAAKTVFFFNLLCPDVSNKLELKINDQSSTTLTCGYYTSGTYHFVDSVAYSMPSGGLYLAYSNVGTDINWETSSDGVNWTVIATTANPYTASALNSVSVELQHKAYATGAPATKTVVDCFNYQAIGGSYSNIEDKTGDSTSNTDGLWRLYTEGFDNGLQCQNDACTGTTPPHITVNSTAASQHFTDSTIPSPTDHSGYHYAILSTDASTTGWYMNTYRYQYLPYVNADTWNYTMHWKFNYPDKIAQAYEFPLNKYTGSKRLQAALQWLPNRDGTTNGHWRVWAGSNVPSPNNVAPYNKWSDNRPGGSAWGFSQNLAKNAWHTISLDATLHDNTVAYTTFISDGTVFNINQSYPGDAGSIQFTVPAMQIDDNIAGDSKDVYIADWTITWSDVRIP